MRTRAISGPQEARGPAAQPSEKPAGPADPHRRVPDWILTVLLGIAMIGALELLTRLDVLSPNIFPMPSRVADSLVAGLMSGQYATALSSTLSATVIGFATSALIAVMSAGLLVSFPRFERVVMPFIVSLQTMPKIALAPVVLLIFGFGAMTKIALIVVVSFFPILINALQGLRIRQRDCLELFTALGATRWQLFRSLRIPGSVPYIFAGFHIGLIFALIGAIVAELVGVPEGLGVIMLQEKARFNIQGLWAVLVVLMVIGILLRQIVLAVERRVAFWAGEAALEAIDRGGVS